MLDYLWFSNWDVRLFSYYSTSVPSFRSFPNKGNQQESISSFSNTIQGVKTSISTLKRLNASSISFVK